MSDVHRRAHRADETEHAGTHGGEPQMAHAHVGVHHNVHPLTCVRRTAGPLRERWITPTFEPSGSASSSGSHNASGAGSTGAGSHT